MVLVKVMRKNREEEQFWADERGEEVLGGMMICWYNHETNTTTTISTDDIRTLIEQGDEYSE